MAVVVCGSVTLFAPSLARRCGGPIPDEVTLSEEPHLELLRDREDADDDPRVHGDLMPLLGGPEEKVEVLLAELVHVLLPDLGDRGCLVAPASA